MAKRKHDETQAAPWLETPPAAETAQVAPEHGADDPFFGIAPDQVLKRVELPDGRVCVVTVDARKHYFPKEA